MTIGSTMALPNDSPLVAAMRKSTAAAARRILTSRSSNCLRTSFQSGVPSSGGSSLRPYRARAADAS